MPFLPSEELLTSTSHAFSCFSYNNIIIIGIETRVIVVFRHRGYSWSRFTVFKSHFTVFNSNLLLIYLSSVCCAAEFISNTISRWWVSQFCLKVKSFPSWFSVFKVTHDNRENSNCPNCVTKVSLYWLRVRVKFRRFVNRNIRVKIPKQQREEVKTEQ